MSESSDTLDTTTTTTTIAAAAAAEAMLHPTPPPTGKRMGPLSFTANSKVDPTKHRSHSLPTIEEVDYADEVLIDYDAIRKSIAEAINYSMNSGIIFR